jgi:putative serine protease PepD
VLALLAGLVGGVVGFVFANRVFTNNGVNPSVSLGSPPPTGSSARPADSVAGIAAKVLPTVVSLDVAGPSQSDTGSGFIIRSDGYILTNNHVIEAAASQGSITVGFNDGSKATATLVGRDPAYDLAVVKVDKKDLPTLALGNSDDIVVGDSVLAVGSPLGLTGTVTTGIVSALNRPVTTGDSSTQDTSFINAIQTDAAINPGNSGGPLVNSAGAAIGINSAIATLSQGSSGSGSIGVGFAIPINQARRTAEEIIQTGKSTKPVIGVTLDIRYTGPGAKIADNAINGAAPVTSGGAADKAGIKAGDIVLSVNGRTVNTADELIVAIRSYKPGDTVTLKVQRGGSTQDIKVTLASESTTK